MAGQTESTKTFEQRIDERLERMETKLDRALEGREALRWMKLILVGAWAAIAWLASLIFGRHSG